MSYIAHVRFISTIVGCVSALGYRVVCKACEGVMQEEQAKAFLSRLQSLLGPGVFVVLARTLEEDFFGNEKDLMKILQERPDLFERAFRAILGEIAGPAILRIVDRELLGRQ